MNDSPRTPEHPEELPELIRAAGPRPDPPEDAARRIREGVEATWRGYSHRRRTLRRVRFLAAAAAILAVVAAGAFYGLRQRPPVEPERVARAGAIVISGFGDLRLGTGSASSPLLLGDETRQLPQGSSLLTGAGSGAVLGLEGAATMRIDENTWLRADSTTSFWLERGRIYLDLPGPETQVKIHTRLGSVQDIGTQFELSTDDERLHLRVRDGRVRLSTEHGELELARGQTAHMEAGASPTLVAEATYGPSWNWLRPFSTAVPGDRLTVASLVEWYAREEGLRVRFVSEAAAQVATTVGVHGDVSALPRDRLLEIALAATTFEIHREGDLLVIGRAAAGR